MQRVYDSLHKNIQINGIYLFTDSKITLAWIRTEITELQAYVANRVGVIQQKIKGWCWLYISCTKTPADLISRGMSPQELPNCALWWKGPKTLHSEYNFNTERLVLPDSLPEIKENSVTTPHVKVVLTTDVQNVFFFVILKVFSNLGKND